MIYAIIVGLIIAAGLALIPANIAKKKGRRFGLWWFYGWMLFIVALIHACLISNENVSGSQGKNSSSGEPNISVADEIKKFKELYDEGIITQEEYDEKKRQLLNL